MARDRLEAALGHLIPFQTVRFSGTRLNDDLRGVACAPVAHGTLQPMEAHAARLLASKRWTLAGPLPAPPALPVSSL